MTHTAHTTCVAFLPGFMQRASAWAPVAARTAAKGWPTRFADLAETGFEASLTAIETAAERGVAVGYSMGGRLAIQAAVRSPRAFSGLVLVGATPGIEDERRRRSRRASDDSLAEWMTTQSIDSIVAHWELQPAFAGQSPELIRAQRAGRLAHDPRVLAAQLRATGQGVVEPVWDRLEELTLPVLAIAGERDEKYADIAFRMATALPNARAAIVAGAGHAAHLEQPDAVAALLAEFLDEHFGQRRVVD